MINDSKCSWILKIFARNFIAGDTIEEAIKNKKLQRLLQETGAKAIFAYEVESTFDETTAKENLEEFKHCATSIKSDRGESMSIKLSALALFNQDPHQSDHPQPRTNRIKHYLKELLNQAVANNVSVCIDMEYFVYKQLTFQIFFELLEENPRYADFLQVAFQCYLRGSCQDARKIVYRACQFYAKTNKKIKLRVVKGANLTMDKQYIVEYKEVAQRQFIEIMELFESHSYCIEVAYGTMNPDSIAHIIQNWQQNAQDLAQRQIQSLFGMRDSLKYALSGMVGQQIYVPYAPLKKTLPYMLRRFTELQQLQKGVLPIMEYNNNGRLIQIN